MYVCIFTRVSMCLYVVLFLWLRDSMSGCGGGRCALNVFVNMWVLAFGMVCQTTWGTLRTFVRFEKQASVSENVFESCSYMCVHSVVSDLLILIRSQDLMVSIGCIRP